MFIERLHHGGVHHPISLGIGRDRAA